MYLYMWSYLQIHPLYCSERMQYTCTCTCTWTCLVDIFNVCAWCCAACTGTPTHSSMNTFKTYRGNLHSFYSICLLHVYISIRNICILTHIILHIVIHIYISTPYVDVDTLNSICTASTCVAVPDSELRLLQQLFFA